MLSLRLGRDALTSFWKHCVPHKAFTCHRSIDFIFEENDCIQIPLQRY